MSQLVTVLIFLLEAVVVIAVGAGYLAFLYRRKLRQNRSLQTQLSSSSEDRTAYERFVRGGLESLREKVQQQIPRGTEVLSSSQPFPVEDPPPVQALRLGVSFLREELESISDSAMKPGKFWMLRHGHGKQLVEHFGAAEVALTRWVDKERMVRVSEKKEADLREQQLRHKLEEAEARLEDLQPYRNRFNDLHHQVNQEAGANREFRQGLREALDQPDTKQIGSLLQSYEGQRQELDQFLDRRDIQPLGEMRRPARPSQLHRVRRTRKLMEAGERRIERSNGQLRDRLQEQEALVGSLREALAKAGEKEEELKAYYNQKVKALEQNIAESERCVEVLEKENYRRKRTIDELLQKMEGQEAPAAPDTRGLEQAVDRFSRQTMELMQRINELEREMEELSTENIELKGRLGRSTTAEERA